MNTNQQFLETLQRRLPDLASPRDLVRVGMYKSQQAAYSARKTGRCPPYLRIPQRGIVYPKAGVLEFLKATSIEPNRQNTTQPKTQNSPIPHRNGPSLRQM